MSQSNGATENRTGTYRFRVLRYDARADSEPRFQTYELEADGRTSVLEALLAIQSRQDPTLAFRYACRGAVCGSCAMSINGQAQLACRVLLGNLPGDEVVLEPLPHFEILRDLVVDLEPFWEKYARVRPWLHAENPPGAEQRMSEQQRAEIDQYVNCILCGLCYAACPTVARHEGFTGPAALAKLYRFVADSRESRGPETLTQEDHEDGLWQCRMITRCIDACPKDVRPADGIAGLRRKLLVHRFKSLWRRAPDET